MKPDRGAGSLARLHGLLRQHIGSNDQLSDKGIAHRVLTALKVRGDALEILLPLVEQETVHLRRGTTRKAEMTAGRKLTGDSALDMIAARQKLLDSAFPLGDGRWVTWGDATVADHEARIDFLARQRDGIIGTIGRHEDAISAIKEASATCLREIEEAA